MDEPPRQRAFYVVFRQRALIHVLALACVACDTQAPGPGPDDDGEGVVASTGTLTARVVATGIAGAGAVRQIGPFLDASPIRTNAPFFGFTAAGQVLHPDRLFVASTSNYGAPLATARDLPGAILSLDVRRQNVVQVPPDFARDGAVNALDNAVILYSAQSSTFSNTVYHADAVTADYTAVSNPLGISLNNAFGRPWFANAPNGAGGIGTITVVDPDGRPLAAIVSRRAGGVFAGDVTNRAPQLSPGSLSSACVATALLGAAPDGTQRAVFASLQVDGSLAQVHVEQGVDGLAPPGTITPLRDRLQPSGPDAEITRAGMAFNWVPRKSLYITDPIAGTVVLVTLGQDLSIFRFESMEVFSSPLFDVPVDIAPAVPDHVNPAFASGSTLSGGTDLYVANRGNGTLVRIKQNGEVLASRHIEVPGLGVLGARRINGVATSVDAMRLFVSVSGEAPDGAPGEGFIVEVEAFGAAR